MGNAGREEQNRGEEFGFGPAWSTSQVFLACVTESLTTSLFHTCPMDPRVARPYWCQALSRGVGSGLSVTKPSRRRRAVFLYLFLLRRKLSQKPFSWVRLSEHQVNGGRSWPGLRGGLTASGSEEEDVEPAGW